VAQKLFPLQLEGGSFFQLLLAEILREGDESRLESLCYCAEQLSVNLREDQQTAYLDLLCQLVQKLADQLLAQEEAQPKRQVRVLLRVLLYFIQNMPEEQVNVLRQFVRRILPLAFLGEEPITAQLNEIIGLLFLTTNKTVLAEYFAEFSSTISNYVAVKGCERPLPNWRDHDSANTYLGIILKALVQLGPSILASSFALLDLFLNLAPEEFLAQEQARILGCLLRVSCFHMSLLERLALQKSMLTLVQTLTLDEFTHHIVASQLMVLGVGRQPLVDSVAGVLSALVARSSRRNSVVPLMLARLSTLGTLLLGVLDILLHEAVAKTTFTRAYLADLALRFREEARSSLDDPEQCCALARLGGLVGLSQQDSLTALRLPGCTFADLQLYLYATLYSGQPLAEVTTIKAFLKESNKEQAVGLLQVLKSLLERQPALKADLNKPQLEALISQTIVGFEEIEELLRLIGQLCE
jgi:hypothetical protein